MRLRRLAATLAGLVVLTGSLAGCTSEVDPEPDGVADQAAAEDEVGSDDAADGEEALEPAAFVPPPSVLAIAAQRDAPAPPDSRDALVATAREIVTAGVEAVGDAPFGVLVVDEHGREIVAHEPDQALLPASTLKIVTAASALLTFGADGRFTTSAKVTAPLDADGVLRGDLVVVGTGDPVLVTDEYARWVYPARPRTLLADLADAVAATGLERIEGDVIGVSDRFPGARTASGWPDRYFSSFDARYSDGLSVDAGLRTLLRYPEPEEDETDGDTDDGAGTAGSEATDGDDPDATESGDEDDDASDDAPDPEELGPPEVLVDHAPDPRQHASSEFARLLEERGVELAGAVRAGAPSGPIVGRLALVESPPMEELLRFAVQRSDNQITDGLFRAVGRARTGAGSWYRADRAARQVLDRLGVDHSQARFADGSGLSRDDRVTARLLVDLDRAMQATRHAAVWRSLMAVTGESGTLDGRLRGTIASGRFAGKTGTLRDVAGLTGTVTLDGQPRYHLAVIVNDADGNQRWVARTVADELILALVADVDGCEVRVADAGEGPLGRPPVLARC
jgi:serine-type D-Ala-D-Ala carboxypeptidase/endopeptidase (penicillin-binding protein 4)